MSNEGTEARRPIQSGAQEEQGEALEMSTIIGRASEGDASALESLYQRFARPVFGLCRNLLGSKEAAEDATHEVFIKVQRSISTYNGSIPFLNWLFSVTSHYCIDVLRRRQREPLWTTEDDVVELAPAHARSPLTEVLVKDQARRVRAAIAHLPGKYRVPLVLEYYSDLSYDEIAEQLHMKRNTVATLIFRAKQELRYALAEERRV